MVVICNSNIRINQLLPTAREQYRLLLRSSPTSLPAFRNITKIEINNECDSDDDIHINTNTSECNKYVQHEIAVEINGNEFISSFRHENDINKKYNKNENEINYRCDNELDLSLDKMKRIFNENDCIYMETLGQYNNGYNLMKKCNIKCLQYTLCAPLYPSTFNYCTTDLFMIYLAHQNLFYLTHSSRSASLSTSVIIIAMPALRVPIRKQIICNYFHYTHNKINLSVAI